MKKNRLEIIAQFSKKETGKLFTSIVGENMFMCSPTIVDMARKMELSEVTFVQEGELETPTGAKFKTWKVSAIKETSIGIVAVAVQVKQAGLTKDDLDVARELVM